MQAPRRGDIMKISMSYWIMLIAVAATAVGCAHHKSYNLPPAERLMQPGPGVGGPGPGVLAPPPAPVVTASMMGGPMMGGPMMGGPMGAPMGMVGCVAVPLVPAKVQILFDRPESMMVSWDISGVGMFDSNPLVVPGRSTFPAGGIYRLKVTNIEGREGVERYPTLEVGPVTPRTEAYLAHNAIPIQLTDEDFDQVAAGNFVTKVIYLPDPEFQQLALAGVETLVSTRLDPGVDPVVEADRRGAILAIIRMGNKDLEVPDGMGGMDPEVMTAGATSAGGVVGAGVACGPNGAYGDCQRGCGPGQGTLPGCPVPYGNVPSYLSGVTVPQYGMPISGTPIGLPGPPHIPLGAPAGLTRHVMTNRTHTSIPEPVHSFHINMRQQPGYSYPAPPTHMRIREQNIHAPIRYGQTIHDADQCIQ